MRRLILLTALILLPVGVCGQSQSSKKAIMGVVKDESGAIIPQVAVIAIAELGEGIDAQEIKKKSATGDDGRYLIGRLTPAIYTVTFAKKGYEKIVYRIRAKHDQDTIIDVVLPRKTK